MRTLLDYTGFCTFYNSKGLRMLHLEILLNVFIRVLTCAYYGAVSCANRMTLFETDSLYWLPLNDHFKGWLCIWLGVSICLWLGSG